MDDESRAACYVFLAQGLVCPEAGFIGGLRQLLGALDEAEKSGALTTEICQVAAGLNDAQALPLDQLQGEHTGLFVNNHPHVPCPPYESAYRENTLMGNATTAVTETYRQWGLEVGGDFADYAGAELEFMAFAIRLSSQDGGDDTLSAQREFLRDHILTWMPRFASDMRKASKLELYRSLGDLLGLFLFLEGEALTVDAPSEHSVPARTALLMPER
jgi:putative dimethyl sulfoxide reductase chaperone